MTHTAPPKQKHTARNILIGLAVVVLLMGGCTVALVAAGGDAVNDAIDELETPTPQPTETTEPQTDEPDENGDNEGGGSDPKPEKQYTVAQENAIGTAADYLDYSAFSRSGLIEQLKFEGYKVTDATIAVDSLKVDWNAQAVAAAKDYLDYSNFSRQGLIDQLMFEGYTESQAVYGVKRTGL